MIDTSQFTGPGAIFALVLAGVRDDYWNAPKDSMAFLTARQFLDGGTCTHLLCLACRRPDESGWERYACEAGPDEDKIVWFEQDEPKDCFDCHHNVDQHWWYEFDWTAHRDYVIGTLGINVPGFVKAVKSGRSF